MNYKLFTYTTIFSFLVVCGEINAQSEFKIRHSVDSILQHIPGKQGERFAHVIANNSIALFLYAPKDKDLQQPHNRDEFYMVSNGSGTFICDDQTTAFKQGDVLFAPAGKDHRFLNFSDDLILWVVFFGERRDPHNNQTVVTRYIQTLNEHDVARIISMQSPDFVFIDAHGSATKGVDELTKAWNKYFQYFPDYKIETSSVSELGGEVVVFGYASASTTDSPGKHWKLPVAVRAIVEDGKISFWQVYSDTKVPFDLLNAH